MALAAAPLDQSFRASPSRVVSRQDAEASSETSSIHSADPFDRREAEILAMSTRSEEYRLMFRLPPDEVLVQDFNCALQENILLQGHMYLFLHHICFYSNIFGFETKKTISFLEVSCVRKAKTAGIFPNAIEILAGGKKHFFGSFLSRDEAYRLIVEGWSQHNNDAKAIFDQQDMKSDVSSSNSSLAIVEFAQGSTQPPSDSLTSDGNMNANILNECLPSSIGENGIIVPSRLVEVKENGEEKAEYLSTGNLSWPVEDVDVPKVPEYFTLVAEAKFLVRVEDFFTLFFSNNAAEFLENFHKGCGDKEFQHTLWHKNEQLGYTRDISFLHPVKIYLGAKFGRCQEVQKFRVYRNSHLVIETSQQISDVPYGDYFKVEGIWDVQQLSSETGCILHVYTNVAFSKKTMFRGKIEQSTKDECREIYALWINNANDLLKQKKDVKLEDAISNDVGSGSSSQPAGDLIQNGISEEIPEAVSDEVFPQSENPMTVNLENCRSAFREAWASLCSHFGGQRYLPFIIAAAFLAVLILMQVSIILILTRVPEVHVVTQGNYMSGLGSYNLENVEWLERRFNYLKEEMLMLESRMERMNHEYTTLKTMQQSIEKLKPKS